MAQKNKSDIFDSDKRSKIRREINTGPCSVSASVMRRMPRYFRYLRNLLNNDILRISSGDLAKLMGITPSQVRQDFNSFGDFGQQGYGYNVKFLYTQVSRILGVNKKFSAVIIGAGNMTRALLTTNIFNIRGIRIRGVFSFNKNETGDDCIGYKIADIDTMKDFCLANDIDIAIIALPDVDNEICGVLSESGVKGVWNFSIHELDTGNIKCQNAMLGDSLMLLMNEIDNDDTLYDKGEQNGN